MKDDGTATLDLVGKNQVGTFSAEMLKADGSAEVAADITLHNEGKPLRLKWVATKGKATFQSKERVYQESLDQVKAEEWSLTNMKDDGTATLDLVGKNQVGTFSAEMLKADGSAEVAADIRSEERRVG